MQRTIRIKLHTNNFLLQTIDIANEIYREILKIGYSKKTYNKNELHKLTYKKLRKKYPTFPSALLQTVRDVASEALKATKLKKGIKAKKRSFLRLDKRNLRVNLLHGSISISSIAGRLKLKFSKNPQIEKYLDWSPVAGTLCYRENKLYLNLVVEKDAPTIQQIQENDVLGIDRGINNIVVCSNNQFFNSNHLKDVKGRYQHLRQVLQSKGTPSARQKLKGLSGREKRFVSDINHRLSKALAESSYKVFALEDLKKMKQNKGKTFNRKLGNWSFKQFENFLRYKSVALGKTVLCVNPKYTSQTCSNCGHCEKTNRLLSRFKCKKCKFELNADLNAARNIAKLGKTEFDRLVVNQPETRSEGFIDLTSHELHLQGEQLQADHFNGR
ncbi:IS200/IS605 family element transposase accessory protein TnpB [Candidatus Micrarchaeota archaeon]|nr:IS200/IS605 family element transposase accessory protein TnpB [Candidatus Micrarchaeota archaeon]